MTSRPRIGIALASGLLLTLLAVAVPVQAHNVSGTIYTNDCDTQGPPEDTAVDQSGYYVKADGVHRGVWQETNGRVGLQAHNVWNDANSNGGQDWNEGWCWVADEKVAP